MHKESKEALLNAEKKCRECLSILKNASWSMEDNCPEETIGAMESAYQKSVDVLLDYWARTITPEDKIMLCIIGGGPVQEELEQQAKDLGIGSMVVFTGAVPHDQMPPYYASCDVYVTASLSDTNSISMLEGMATGLPVLRRYDALNENVDQVRDGVNGYIFNSPEEMAAELRRIKNLSPEQLSILKASVIESVKRSGAEALANYTYNVYRKAMASASNPKEK